MSVGAVSQWVVELDWPNLNQRVPGRASQIVPVVAVASRSETARIETGLVAAGKSLAGAARRCRVGFGRVRPSDHVARVRFIVAAPSVPGAVGGDDCVGRKRETEGVCQIGAAKTYAALTHLVFAFNFDLA